jgi:hypothetical protein
LRGDDAGVTPGITPGITPGVTPGVTPSGSNPGITPVVISSQIAAATCCGLLRKKLATHQNCNCCPETIDV